MTWLEKLTTGWKQFKNGRLYRRVPTDISVKIRPLATGELVEARITNWSPGGVFITTPARIPMESLVQLEFPIGRDDGSFLRLNGQIVRVQNGTPNSGPEGLGIMFTDFTQSGLNVLREVLLQMEHRPPAEA